MKVLSHSWPLRPLTGKDNGDFLFIHSKLFLKLADLQVFKQSSDTVNTPLCLLWQGSFSALKKNSIAPAIIKQALGDKDAHHENTCNFVKK
jgi:hypothetical protein